MKRLLSLAVVCSFPLSLWAEDILTDGIWNYTVANGEAKVVDFVKSANMNLIIPDVLGGYPVTAIGPFALYGWYGGLTSLTLPACFKRMEFETDFFCMGMRIHCNILLLIVMCQLDGVELLGRWFSQKNMPTIGER